MTRRQNMKRKKGKRGMTVNHERYSPPKIVGIAWNVLQQIDIDPLSSDEANTLVGAGVYYTKETDGFKHDWYGNLYTAPMGSVSAEFSRKLLEQIKRGNTKQAVVMVTSSTSADWWRRLYTYCTSVCFLSKRVRLVPSAGLAQTLCLEPMGNKNACTHTAGHKTPHGAGAPNRDHHLFYFGPDLEEFESECEAVFPGSVFARGTDPLI